VALRKLLGFLEEGKVGETGETGRKNHHPSSEKISSVKEGDPGASMRTLRERKDAKGEEILKGIKRKESRRHLDNREFKKKW